MNNDTLFVEYKFPKPLKKEELLECLNQAKEGNFEIRNKVIIYNLRLVLGQVLGKYASFPYEKKELVSVGIIGLIKAVNTFDVTKNFEFSTYAIKCIDNEIAMFLRQKQKCLNEDSLEKEIYIDKNGNEIKLQDTIVDENCNIIDMIEKKEIILEIRKQVENLNEGRNKEIIKLYFGFYNNKIYSQSEIATIYRLSQCQISRIITKTVDLIANNLINKNYIEKNKKRTKVKNK